MSKTKERAFKDKALFLEASRLVTEFSKKLPRSTPFWDLRRKANELSNELDRSTPTCPRCGAMGRCTERRSKMMDVDHHLWDVATAIDRLAQEVERLRDALGVKP